jgi:hypothetical protein
MEFQDNNSYALNGILASSCLDDLLFSQVHGASIAGQSNFFKNKGGLGSITSQISANKNGPTPRGLYYDQLKNDTQM